LLLQPEQKVITNKIF